ncbi:murein biosynthesis integral membrane protein MurJ, partial [Modestobacter sp. I12A-02628]
RAPGVGGPPVAAPPPVPGRPPLPPVPPPPARRAARSSAWQDDRRRSLSPPTEIHLISALPPVPPPYRQREERPQPAGERPGGSRGLLRAVGGMAVATTVSRLTGFVRTVALTAVLGLGALTVNNAYTVANTLPNIVYELLLGGVLTSVIVPLLVSAQEKHADGGVAYTQRLMTLMLAGLTLLTVVAVVAAPLLTELLGISGSTEQRALGNWLARILLVEIVFYGVGAMAGAILNSRGVFGPPAWAPVLNNVVVIATAGILGLASGPGQITAVSIEPWQVWLLGLGTLLGIAVQSLVLLPLLGRNGVPLRLRWGLRGTGLGEASSLGIWVIGYVLVSQVGVVVASRVAGEAAESGGLGQAAFANASLLFQMPYGIIGVALLTALLPRMSRAAARADVPGVVADLVLGTRLSALGLLPVTALLVVLGPATATVAFGHGNTTVEEARAVGTALAIGAFGLLPMAVTLLQLRVFYAMKDARTPTLIQVAMVSVRVPLMLLVPVVVEPRHVVAGLMLATGVTYVAGWIAGDIALRRRLGALRTRDALDTLLRTAAASVVAELLGWGAVTLVERAVGEGVAGSLVTLLVGTVVIGVAVSAGAVVARVPEARGVLDRIRSRRPGSGPPRGPDQGDADAPGRPPAVSTGGRQRP